MLLEPTDPRYGSLSFTGVSMSRVYEFACPVCFAHFSVEGARDRQEALSAANQEWHHHKERGDCIRELESLGLQVHEVQGVRL